jgi:hypothetical protein
MQNPGDIPLIGVVIQVAVLGMIQISKESSLLTRISHEGIKESG